ncbi:hypothetical protein vseg_002035 [Gypsophila vaccaria]
MSFVVQTNSSGSTPPSATVSTGLVCTHCGKTGRDYDHCYQRIGYPAQGRGRGRFSRDSGSHMAGRGHPQSVIAHAAQTSRMDTPNTSSSSPPMAVILGLSSEKVQQLITLLDNASASSKLSGPQFEDADWSG